MFLFQNGGFRTFYARLDYCSYRFQTRTKLFIKKKVYDLSQNP